MSSPTPTTPPPSPSAAALARLLAERAGPEALSRAEVDYVVARLSDRGVFPDVHNWGGVACLVPHEHGDGVICARTGPLFDRRYIRVYGSDEDGIDDLIRIAHHATLSGVVVDVDPNTSTNVGGYRSVESFGSDEPDVAGSSADRLDGSVPSKLSGITADLFGPSPEAQRRIEEVAAQWSALFEKMKRNPTVFKVLTPQFDHWLDFWKKYQKRNDLSGEELTALSEDVRSVIADVNAARANAEEIERGKTVAVQDLPACGPGDAKKGVACKTADIASEDVSKARGAAQAAEDAGKGCFSSPEALQKCITEWFSKNEWKVAAAGVVGVVGIALAAKAGAKVARMGL